VQSSADEVQSTRATNSRLREQLKELVATVESRDQQVSALTRDSAATSLQSADELKRAKAACAELEQHAESLKNQIREHTECISEMKACRVEMEKRHTDQVGPHHLSVAMLELHSGREP
jgi:predicted  nucleic acid-binding Zn-ribbon protein